jgi:hypothetical protein
MKNIDINNDNATKLETITVDKNYNGVLKEFWLRTYRNIDKPNLVSIIKHKNRFIMYINGIDSTNWDEEL